MHFLRRGVASDTADHAYRTWAASYDMSAAEALRVPHNFKYYVGSDSSLLLYSHVPGKESKAGTSIYKIQSKYPYYEISSADIRAGATVRDIIDNLPREDIDSYDITLAVRMLNDVAGDAAWDVIVQNDAYGTGPCVPTIDGLSYFTEIERANDGWHSTNTDASHLIYTKLYEEARNVAYAPNKKKASTCLCLVHSRAL